MPIIKLSEKSNLSAVQSEVRQLVDRGRVSRHQPIYTLCQYIPSREWINFENELERCGYLLRDPIGDLLSSEDWSDD